MKPLCADDSVGSPHVKVGHRQEFNPKPRMLAHAGFFYASRSVYNLTVRARLPTTQQPLVIYAFWGDAMSWVQQELGASA